MVMHRGVFSTAPPSAPASATGLTEGTRSRGVMLRRRIGGGSLGSSSGPPGALPHPLEEILQRAFSHVSSDSFITEFVRRTMDGQSRGNPPASKFAIENLSKDGGKDADACAICQDDITSGCKSLQMPCLHCYHRDCLHRWLSEHNTCPVCRCEVESNCPRYNEANYNELKGKLDKVTVSNHADPSKIEPPPSNFLFGPPSSSSLASGASPGGATRTFRMTIPMPHGGNFGWLSENTSTPPTTARPHPGGGVDGARPRGAASRGIPSSSIPNSFLARSAQQSSRSPRRTMPSGSPASSRRTPQSTRLESSMDFDTGFFGVGDSSIFSPGSFTPPFSTPADFETLFMRSPRSPAAPGSSSSSNQTRGGPRQAAAAAAAAATAATAAAASAASPGRGQKRSRQGNSPAASPQSDRNCSSSSPFAVSLGDRRGGLPTLATRAREDGDARVGAQGARSGSGAGGTPEEESNAPVARRTRRRLNKGNPQ